MSFDGTEGTDSTSTDTYDIGTILSLMDSKVTCNPKKSTDSLTDSLNNMDLRDTSASKNGKVSKPRCFETKVSYSARESRSLKP